MKPFEYCMRMLQKAIRLQEPIDVSQSIEYNMLSKKEQDFLKILMRQNYRRKDFHYNPEKLDNA